MRSAQLGKLISLDVSRGSLVGVTELPLLTLTIPFVTADSGIPIVSSLIIWV